MFGYNRELSLIYLFILEWDGEGKKYYLNNQQKIRKSKKKKDF